MIFIGGDELLGEIVMGDLIDEIEKAFVDGVVALPRQINDIVGGEQSGLLLTMCAMSATGETAVKLSTVFGGNPAKGLPAIHGVIVVFNSNGRPTAMLDGATATKLRTSAASALASKYLSRKNSRTLLVVGTGALAPFMAYAHASVRSIDKIYVWGRRGEAVNATIDAIRRFIGEKTDITVSKSLPADAQRADIISCATSATEPVLKGSWVKDGTFVDLVGSFSPHAREVDDDLVLRARIFVDSVEGALAEAGDLLSPISRGVIDREAVLGDLFMLTKGELKGRVSETEITLFKSVGTSVEDFAIGHLALQMCAKRRPR